MLMMNRVTDEVSDLWSGSNDDFWAAYLKEVLGETNVDEEHTSGENYRIRDLGGGNVTVEKKNSEGTWEKVGDANSLSEEAAEEQLINARLMSEASSAIGTFSKEYQVLASDLANATGLDTSNESIGNILTSYEKGEAIDFSEYGYDFVKSIDFSKINDTDFKNYLETAANEYTNTFSQAYKNVYDSLSDEDRELLSTLTIDPDATEEEIRKALEAMQIIADNNAILVSIKAKEAALELWESGDLAGFWDLVGKDDDAGKQLRAAFIKALGLDSDATFDEIKKEILDRFSRNELTIDDITTILTSGSSALDVYGNTWSQEARDTARTNAQNENFGTYTFDGQTFDNYDDAKAYYDEHKDDYVDRATSEERSKKNEAWSEYNDAKTTYERNKNNVVFGTGMTYAEYEAGLRSGEEYSEYIETLMFLSKAGQADTAMAFAEDPYNDAVDEYNAAVSTATTELDNFALKLGEAEAAGTKAADEASGTEQIVSEMEVKAEVEAEGIDWDEYQAYIELLKDSTDVYDDNVQGLNKVAFANKRMEKGVKTLNGKWDDFNSIMTDSNASLEDLSTVAPEIEEGLKDILNFYEVFG